MASNTSTTVQLTWFEKGKGVLTKVLYIDEQGMLVKDSSQCALSDGVCKTVEVHGLEGLQNFLDSLKPHQAVGYGISGREGEIQLVSERRLAENCGAITRTRTNFQFPSPAVFMVDYDPPEGSNPCSPDQLYGIITGAMPELHYTNMLWRPSASSCIYRDEEELAGIVGQRFYFLVDDGEKIPDIGKIMEQRLWLKGYGYIKLSKAGQKLKRCAVDTAVWQPERLDFAAGAVCMPPLERRPVSSMIFRGRHA